MAVLCRQLTMPATSQGHSARLWLFWQRQVSVRHVIIFTLNNITDVSPTEQRSLSLRLHTAGHMLQYTLPVQVNKSIQSDRHWRNSVQKNFWLPDGFKTSNLTSIHMYSSPFLLALCREKAVGCSPDRSTKQGSGKEGVCLLCSSGDTFLPQATMAGFQFPIPPALICHHLLSQWKGLN